MIEIGTEAGETGAAALGAVAATVIGGGTLVRVWRRERWRAAAVAVGAATRRRRSTRKRRATRGTGGLGPGVGVSAEATATAHPVDRGSFYELNLGLDMQS
jgi:hypothetical protein